MASRAEILAEIQRVTQAREKSSSEHLRKDYGKYLRKLYRELRGAK